MLHISNTMEMVRLNSWFKLECAYIQIINVRVTTSPQSIDGFRVLDMLTSLDLIVVVQKINPFSQHFLKSTESIRLTQGVVSLLISQCMEQPRLEVPLSL